LKQAGKKEGDWGEFRHARANTKSGQPRHLPEYLEGRTPQKNTLFIKRRKNRRAQNQKKCGKNFQFWIFAKQKGGSIIFYISFFLYFGRHRPTQPNAGGSKEFPKR